VRRVFAIVNPAAGGGSTASTWPAVRGAFAAEGAALEWVTTAGPGDAARLAREAAAGGWPLVVAVGGDGTLNEVTDGVIAAGSGAAVGAVMTGRGRDACRNFGVPNDPRAAARRVLGGSTVPLDVGVAHWDDGARRCFLIACGAGFDAAVARRAAAGGGWGTLPYVRAIVASLATHSPAVTRVELDGAAAWGDALTAVVVANAAYYGGGMRIAPAAVPDDGLLDVLVLGAFGRLELLRWLPSVYRGAHLRHPRVVAFRARHVRITAPAPLPTHVDGEVTAPTPVTVSVLPRALRFVR